MIFLGSQLRKQRREQLLLAQPLKKQCLDGAVIFRKYCPRLNRARPTAHGPWRHGSDSCLTNKACRASRHHPVTPPVAAPAPAPLAAPAGFRLAAPAEILTGAALIGALPLAGRGLSPRQRRHRGLPHPGRLFHALGAMRPHVGARVGGDALASRRGLAQPGLRRVRWPGFPLARRPLRAFRFRAGRSPPSRASAARNPPATRRRRGRGEAASVGDGGVRRGG